MKIWVITKGRGVVILIAFVVAITMISLVKTESVAVSGKARDLPIYCVDKGEEKIASISFDAAWGNGRYGH